MSDGKNGFEKTKHNFPYKWTLKDAVFTKEKAKIESTAKALEGVELKPNELSLS